MKSFTEVNNAKPYTEVKVEEEQKDEKNNFSLDVKKDMGVGTNFYQRLRNNRNNIIIDNEKKVSDDDTTLKKAVSSTSQFFNI
jgi:hypothetical protein